jgi:DNA-binding GntR family transcriptional regulator
MNAKIQTPKVDEHAPMQERVYAMIKSMIADGRIRPGQRLLEVHVARAFSVSRSPARRALQALCVEKTVYEAERRGYVVAGRRSGHYDDEGDLAVISENAIEPTPRWKQVYMELEREISVGVATHSLRITEDRVAEYFDVSRTVARDALARLHSSGVVGKDRQGRWVAERLTANRIRSLYELRWLIEPEALIQSAQAMPDEVVLEARDKLIHALANMPALGSDLHFELEDDMHVRLLAACPNTELLRVLGNTRLLLVSNPHRIHLYADDRQRQLEESLQQHLEVVELLLSNRRRPAAEALRKHLKGSCDFWLDHWDRVQAHAADALPAYLSSIDAGN